MISIILAQKIAAMLFMVFCGFLLVKFGIVKLEDSRVLSLIMLYLIMPSAVFNTFMVDYSTEVRNGILLTAGVALAFHIIMILLNMGFRRIFHLSGVESASTVYSNAGNLILPIVSGLVGEEYQIYAIGYMAVQLFFMWSHGESLVAGKTRIQWKKILLNINMFAVYFGILFFATGFRLPSPIHTGISAIASMIGPVAMLVIGMLLTKIDLKKLILNPKAWIVALLRLIVYPLICILAVKISGMTGLIENGKMILLVTMLAVMAPVASTVTQFAQIYDQDADYAGAISVMTTLMCIITMPLLTALYQM